MTVKELAEKKDRTEAEEKELKDKIDSFKEEINDVCKNHGLAYKSSLSISPDGVVPTLTVVIIEEKEND